MVSGWNTDRRRHSGREGPSSFCYLDRGSIIYILPDFVVKADGTNIEKDSPVGLLNNWLHSLFSHVDVSLNDTFVTSSTNAYHYRAYSEALLRPSRPNSLGAGGHVEFLLPRLGGRTGAPRQSRRYEPRCG